MNFAHLASFQAREFVSSYENEDPENEDLRLPYENEDPPTKTKTHY